MKLRDNPFAHPVKTFFNTKLMAKSFYQAFLSTLNRAFSFGHLMTVLGFDRKWYQNQRFGTKNQVLVQKSGFW